MNIPFDSDFDKPAHEPVAPAVRTPHEQSVFDGFSGSIAFVIGLITAILFSGAIGFFVLLAFIL